MKTPKAFLSGFNMYSGSQGPVKEAGTELHEAMPLPLGASFSHILTQNISEPSKQKTGKKPIPSPHLHPGGEQ